MRRNAPWALALVLLCACSKGPEAPAGGGSGGIGGATGGSGGSGGVACPDLDRDGHTDASCGGDDCDDNDPETYPGAKEICRDGVDQNCDKVPDDGCACSLGDVQACWTYPDAGKRGVGICSDGWQRCDRYGVFGDCTGEVDPQVEPATCDGIDQDCDGSDVAACSGCLDHEICGNGLDDDCNGTIDDPTFCNTSCLPSATPLPDYLLCCSDGATHSYTCLDAPGLAQCGTPQRACLDLDGDPATVCVKRCAGDGTCLCGRPSGSSADPAPDCGFETPCNRMGCEERQGQPCYSGHPGTLGLGICHAGVASCSAGVWGECAGEVKPGKEICGNGLDDDCDGLIDEDDGTGHRCPRTDCTADESCEDGTDNNCNGFVDEGCLADATEQACYSGAIATMNVGVCKQGTQKKQADGYWGPCLGEVTPGPERCGDGLDTDCNSRGGPGQSEDAGCCIPTGKETCNGLDDDCDGIVDEGVINSCGTCDVSCGGELTFDPADDCAAAGRTCTRLKAADGGGLLVNDDAALAHPDMGLYFLGPAGVRRFDTASGDTDWDVPGYGPTSFVYLGASVDGTLWISDYTAKQLVHTDKNGNVVCVLAAPSGQYFGTPAPDEEGTAWVVGSDGFTSASLYAFPADSIDDSTDPPACVPQKLGKDDPGLALQVTSVYTPAVGKPPDLWFSGYPTGLHVDRSNLAQTPITMPGSSYSVMAVGKDGDVWASVFGTTSNLLHIPPGDDNGSNAGIFDAYMTSLADRDDGLVWGITSDFKLASFDPVSETLSPVDLPAEITGATDVANDSSGLLWVTGYNSAVTYSLWSYDPARKFWKSYDQAPTGFGSMNNRTAAGPSRFARFRGTWTQDIDGGSNGVSWTQVTLDADRPSGTSMEISVRAADRKENLDGRKGCGPFSNSTADLSVCLGGEPVGRFMRVTVGLKGTPTASPLLRSVKVDYQRP